MKPKKHQTCCFRLLAPNTMLVYAQDHMIPSRMLPVAQTLLLSAVGVDRHPPSSAFPL